MCPSDRGPYLKNIIAKLERAEGNRNDKWNERDYWTYEKRLRKMGLFSLERRWGWGELIEEFELAKGHNAIKFDPFESVPLSIAFERRIKGLLFYRKCDDKQRKDLKVVS